VDLRYARDEGLFIVIRSHLARHSIRHGVANEQGDRLGVSVRFCYASSLSAVDWTREAGIRNSSGSLPVRRYVAFRGDDPIATALARRTCKTAICRL
jgi:hypothetical protein